MWKLRDYQIEDIAKLMRNERFMLLGDPGTGKTPPACVYTYWVWSQLGKKSVWVQPKSIIAKNREELLRWTNFSPEEVVVIDDDEDGGVYRRLVSAKYELLNRLFKAEFADEKQVPANFRKTLKQLRDTGDIHLNSLTLTEQGVSSLPAPEHHDLRQIATGSWKKVPSRRRQAWSKLGLLDSSGTSVTEKGVKALSEYKVINPALYKAKVVMLGPDSFSRDWEAICEAMGTAGMVVVDEFHLCYSTHDSKRTQSWYRALKKIPRLVVMTGTLINGRYSSAYPAIHAIEPRYYGNYRSFIAQHAIEDANDNVIGWKNPERLGHIIINHSVRHTFQEVYGAEAKVIIREEVLLGPKVRAKYKELEEKALIELSDSFVDAGTPGVHAIRARQLLAVPELFEIDERPTKDELLEVHLAEPGAGIVFGCFRGELERLAKAAAGAGRNAAIMDGQTSAADRIKIDEAFRAGRVDLLVCSWKVAGIGFNWHHVDWIYANSLSYQDGDFLQGYRRAIRGVREHPLRIYIPQYKDTIDKRVMEIVERKSREASKIDSSREVFSLSA